MTVAALHFLTPLGALAALVAIVPLATAALAARQGRHAARTLGLRHARPRSALARPAAGVLVCVLLGLAAAQPVLVSHGQQRVRTRSEVQFVVDVSRSMLAAASARSPTRLERARAAVARLRGDVADVPAGLAGLTDRVLPYSFPAGTRSTFDDVLARSVLVDAPPPQDVSVVATSFDALSALARDGFFRSGATRRTCVLVTDGESRPFSSAAVAQALGSRGCSLLVVRVGNQGEHVYDGDGEVEAGYRADPAAAAAVRQLAAATGGAAFDERELDRAGTALRRLAEHGPTARVRTATTERRLAPALAGCALAVALALVVSGIGPPRRKRVA
jgi:hypothetical protein